MMVGKQRRVRKRWLNNKRHYGNHIWWSHCCRRRSSFLVLCIHSCRVYCPNIERPGVILTIRVMYFPSWTSFHSFWLSTQAMQCLSHFISLPISVSDSQDEYVRVRNAPSRRDFRDRMYVGLRPSHQVAFIEYRHSGIVLPFGAAKAQFNCPNCSLFSPDGKWLQTDYADPLEGWE